MADIGHSFGRVELIDFFEDVQIGYLKEGAILRGDIISINFVEYFRVTDLFPVKV